MLGPMLALERFPPKVGIFDTRQRSVQRWKQVATSIWYTATRCDMCSPVVSSLEFGVVTVTCEITYEKHPGHKNKNTLQDAWTEVANELSVTMPVVALKKKKESLMSTYRTLRKKIVDSETTGSGSQDVYYPSWFAYNAIDRFIRVQNTKIPSLNSEDVADGNIYETEDPMQNEGDLDHINVEEDGLEASSLGDNGIQNVRRENTQENRNMFSVPQSPLMKRKQRSVDNSQFVSKHLKQASDVLQSLVKKPNSQQNKDGPDLYAQLLAEKLRQLSPRNRLLLEHKIDNMVFEALIQEMDSKTQGHFPRTINTVSSPCSSLESYISLRSTYSTHEFSHSPSPYKQYPGTSYTPHLTASHAYIQPSQSQQQNVLEFYSNSEQFVDVESVNKMSSTVRVGLLLICDLLRKELLKFKSKKTKKRRLWTRKWILRRNTLGASTNLLKELSVDPKSFYNHLRMNEDMFLYLLEKGSPYIQKENTNMREALPARMKLEIVLRFLATGDSFASLSALYRVPKCTISCFLLDVLEAIYKALENFIKTIAADKSKPELSNFFQQTRDVTAKACGVSLACVKKVCSEAKKELEVGPSNKIAFKSPRKSYKRVKVMSSLDDFDNEVVRRTIHSFYDKGEFPTTAKILVAMQEKINYPGSKTSVKRISHNLNFKYKKCNNGRKFLMERNDIVACRVKFLRKMYELRQNNDTRPVVYLDETCVNQNHTQGYKWQNPENTEGLKVPIGKGARLIVCHAGSPSFGFVNNSKLVFRCKSGKEPSFVVMDNGSYHSVLAEEYPRANARKADIQKWLEKKSISYSPVETLCELHEKVKMAIPREKKYKLDSVALQMGHEVVRLPPYHCQYNPIELIWAQVKGEVAKKNSTFKMADVEVLVNNALDEITKEVWTKCGEHCNKLQDADFIKEGLRDEILEPIILTINPDDSSTDEDENDDDELPY
ncbi:hypothetical protein QTP88_019643 [Uroleucon formosanum]